MKNVICSLAGHKFTVLRKLSEHTKHVCCSRCYREWAMNDEVKGFLPWDNEFLVLYRDTFQTFDQLKA